MNVAVIPARGGSKRIPKKNIKLFNKKPMIAYPIEVAIKSKLFDLVIVSSDDQEIISISNKYGADTPFIRPKEISDDFTPTVPVIRHALNYLNKKYLNIKNICAIYPCNPFLKVEDLICSFEIFNKNRSKYCFPVAEFESSIHRALIFQEDNFVVPINSKNQLIRTQDLQQVYFDVGMFYWGNNECWNKNEFIHTDSSAYIIPNWRTVDIDTKEDWKRAEIMYDFLEKLK